MDESELAGAEWQTLTPTNTKGKNSAEIALNLPDIVAVRHGNDTGNPVVFTREMWEELVLGIKAGEF